MVAEDGWIEFLADYDVEIVHRPGKENMADPLSRITDEGNDQVNRCSESHSCLATDSNNDEDDVSIVSIPVVDGYLYHAGTSCTTSRTSVTPTSLRTSSSSLLLSVAKQE